MPAILLRRPASTDGPQLLLGERHLAASLARNLDEPSLGTRRNGAGKGYAVTHFSRYRPPRSRHCKRSLLAATLTRPACVQGRLESKMDTTPWLTLVLGTVLGFVVNILAMHFYPGIN